MLTQVAVLMWAATYGLSDAQVRAFLDTLPADTRRVWEACMVRGRAPEQRDPDYVTAYPLYELALQQFTAYAQANGQTQLQETTHER